MVRITETLILGGWDIGIQRDVVWEVLICDRRSKGISCLQLRYIV